MGKIVKKKWSTNDLVVKVSAYRWRLVRAKIICQRTFLSLLKAIKHKASHSTSPSNSCSNHAPLQATHSINIDDDQTSPYFSEADQTNLSKLVKEKNFDQLNQIGGIDVIAHSLQTHVENGINGDLEDVTRRMETFGTNTYIEPPTKKFHQFVLEDFLEPINLVLLVCAAFSLGFGIKKHGLKEGWYDGGSIFVAVFLHIYDSSLRDFRQSKQFDKLSKVINNIQVEVVRNGRRQQISIFEIVVGDVACLNIGDQIPADGLFLDGHSLLVDESSMTGEADHVEIDHIQNPFLVSGTKVADGYAKMLITSVGMNTTWGEMMTTLTSNSNEQTLLQYRLNKLTSAIGKMAVVVAVVVFVILLVRHFTGAKKDDNGNKEFNVMIGVVGIIADAITIVVVAIPVGLPLAVTRTLEYSMKRMMKDHAMVRKLSACETMGSATVICTDKTGSLTLNQMKVTRFRHGQELDEDQGSISATVLELLQEGVSLNTTGTVQRTSDSSGSDFEFSGSPTEKAILQWAVLELNMDVEMIKQKCTILNVEAFNSEKKKSGVLMRRNVDNTTHVHWKGAAEMILEICSHYYDSAGNKKVIEDRERGRFGHLIEDMAASGLRCIAFACRELKENPTSLATDKEVPDESLIFLGIVALKDPCRPGSKKAIEDCQNAGVNIKMITGDNVFAAKAIATECGILHPDQDLSNGVVVEGVEFRNYTEEERMERVDKICVMARSSPFDKLLMVQCLKRKGHVVAVTGDGTNDAPALKEADIGLSMGIQGTEVAKESSDIVILDDNFESVATVMKWGRCVYNNIQKFIQFQLTANVASLVINFVTALLHSDVQVTLVQLFWMNLIMDTLGAFALASERPTNELMKSKLVGRTEALITNAMWRNILAQALYQITIMLTLQFRGKSIFGVNDEVKKTLIFNTFVLCQVLNVFNVRNLEKKNVFKGIHKNKSFMGIVGVTIIRRLRVHRG